MIGWYKIQILVEILFSVWDKNCAQTLHTCSTKKYTTKTIIVIWPLNKSLNKHPSQRTGGFCCWNKVSTAYLQLQHVHNRENARHNGVTWTTFIPTAQNKIVNNLTPKVLNYNDAIHLIVQVCAGYQMTWKGRLPVCTYTNIKTFHK